eukprot:CAMPEP_0116017214 /NCGR_PEP_ID=MMETSP0321-20121206/7919_1 /TAXON_ID=163516 /ORGANISM="Leptocylindrus danicus var. danicus, Strain B650" /LENGTH=211 /DNA_ID=CAMNT_0003487373 /DNA_START=29 /DNA_END=664 /DNA_ORIENTATION=-
MSIHFMPVEHQTSMVTLSVLFFNHLNLFISFCEITLGLHISTIKEDYKMLKEHYKGKEFDACIAFLTFPINSIGELFDGRRVWSKMWSTYSLYDPSYQNYESFGFFIDVGNGWTTILPTTIVDLAIVRPDIMSEYVLLVGCVGIATYWQMMYGALIYYLSYFFNERYVGKSSGEIAGFVGFSNSLWVIFPLVGIYASVRVLDDGDFRVFAS